MYMCSNKDETAQTKSYIALSRILIIIEHTIDPNLGIDSLMKASIGMRAEAT